MKVLEKINIASRFLITRVRSAYYRFLINASGGYCGEGLKVHGPIFIVGALSNLKIGAHVSLNHSVILNCRAVIELGNHTTISAGCQIQTPYLTGENLEEHDSKPIRISNQCWLAANVIVIAGSVIEERVIVGAMSLVRGRLRRNGFYAGIPAERKKEL